MCVVHENVHVILLLVLQGRKSNVKIHEDANGNIYTTGVTMKPVNSAQDVSIIVWF